MDTVQYVLSGYLPYVLFRLPSKHALQAALLTCYSGFLPYVLFRLPVLPAVQAIPITYLLFRLSLHPTCCAGYLPYVLFSTGGVVLALTLAGSAACFMQHVKVMSGSA